MDFKGKLRGGIAYMRDGIFYLKHKLSGTPYSHYYAERMDHIVRHNPAWGLNLNKEFQLEYLKRHGLAPDHSLLDYGCGALAAGIHFIEYLQAGKYVGVDISAEVIEEGRRRIASRNLLHKQPELHVIHSASLECLVGRRFDFIWAQSVFTHMPPSDIERLLSRMGVSLSSQGWFYATFGRREDGIRQKRFKDWYYAPDFFLAQAAEHGLHIEFMSDWYHPEDPQGTDTLVRFTNLDGPMGR